MFGKNPLEMAKALGPGEVCDALRLALIAEIDAVTLYTQLARRIADPLVKKVFLAVADEEKEHMGEFLSLLKKCDPGLVEMMKRGEEEVEEISEKGLEGEAR